MNIDNKPSQDIIDAVTRMQTYIANHIREPITQLQLAKSAGYSPFYSARIFKELTEKTPFEYIRRVRLSESAIVLRDEKVKVLDVALDFVFDSHEGFTRAFSKEFGVSPKKYSSSPKPVKLFLPNYIRDFYLISKKSKENNIMSETPHTVFVQIMERPARKLILKRGQKSKDYFGYCDEVGCDIWGILCSIKEALYEPCGMWMPDNLRPVGTSVYTQGVEVPVDYIGEVPDGFDIIELPPCKMMIFQGPPFQEENFCEAVDELSSQAEKYNPEIYGYKWADELAPKFQLSPEAYRGAIEARPVTLINKN